MESEKKNKKKNEELNGKAKGENIEKVENEKEENQEKETEKKTEKRDEVMGSSINNTEIVEDEILDKYELFSNVYSFSDDFDYIDSEESTSSKTLGSKFFF